MSRPAIRLVCFDLGGVIVRICRSWDEGCAAANLPALNGEPTSHVDPTAHPLFRELNHLHQTGRIGLAEYASRFSEAIAGRYAPHEIEAVYGAWIHGEYEGVGEVIDAIHDAGLETATLSNTSAEHWAALVKSPAIARIRHRHASHLLGLAKPQPAAYRAFEERVGFAGGEILFFDDLAENISAALELGWRAVQIDHNGSTAEQILDALAAHRVLSSRSGIKASRH